jgi:hypothetical protein
VRGGEAGLRLRGHLHLPVQGAVVMRHPPTRFFFTYFFLSSDLSWSQYTCRAEIYSFLEIINEDTRFFSLEKS